MVPGKDNPALPIRSAARGEGELAGVHGVVGPGSCSVCGGQVASTDAFCRTCGHELLITRGSEAEESRSVSEASKAEKASGSTLPPAQDVVRVEPATSLRRPDTIDLSIPDKLTDAAGSNVAAETPLPHEVEREESALEGAREQVPGSASDRLGTVRRPSKWKRKAVIAISLAAALSVLLTVASSAVSSSGEGRDLSQIRTAVAKGEFNRARGLLTAFLKNHNNSSEATRLDKLIAKGQMWSEAFQSARTAETNGDYLGAHRQYMSIPKEDRWHYEEASKAAARTLASAVAESLPKIASLEAQKNYTEALALATSVLEFAPQNAQLKAAQARLSSTIERIEAARRAADAARRAKMLASGKAAFESLRRKRDAFNGVTWYSDPSSPRYVNQDGFFLYIGRHDSGTISLRLEIQYEDDSWLFIERYVFLVDGKTFEISPGYGEVERDNDSNIWEWYDTPVESSEREIVDAIVNSRSAVIKFEGTQYHDTRRITTTQRSALRNVLKAYQYLNAAAA